MSGLQIDGVLATKVAVRLPRTGIVSRRALIETARDSGARVVGVTAPAGYGKSTLLAEWAAVEDRPVAWATLDRFDDDPGSFLTLIASACAAISPRVAELVPEMLSSGTSSLGRAAPLLGDALSAIATPFVLFVDDVHKAGSDGCQDVLDVVLTGVPDGSQVVLTSRHEQSCFARLRITGATFEIGQEALRIDAEGARQIFSDARVPASSEEVALAVSRCEGWPAGLFLCALTVRAGGALSSLTGDERFVADYLQRESFAGLPDDLQLFLRRTAVLDELSGSLCDAVLGTRDSQALLRRVEELNLFLVPLDRRRHRYRYHSLFREFLLTELRRREDDLVTGLHLRAADWLEQSGSRERAIEHLLAAGERQRAGALVAEVALLTHARGQFAVLDRWLSQIGDAVVDASAELVVLATWTALLHGHSPESERRSSMLEALEPDTSSAQDRVTLASARAMIRAARCAQSPEAILEDARYAVANEPEWSPWRDSALYLLGTTLLIGGEREAAATAFAQSSASALSNGNTDSILLSEAELAISAIAEDAWPVAKTHSDRALRTIEDNHMDGYSTAALALAVAARIALRRDDPAASSLLARAMRARVEATHVLPYLAVVTRLHLAKAFAEMGDRTAATHLLREVDEILARGVKLGALIGEIDQFRARLRGTVERAATVPLTPAELRLLPYLQTHLTLAEIGSRLFISRNTVSSEVGSIYRKFGVTSRSAAVDRALAGGLLGG